MRERGARLARRSRSTRGRLLDEHPARDRRARRQRRRARARARRHRRREDRRGGAAARARAARFTLRVARGDGARALDLLRALGLPREPRHGFSETYGQPSLIPTASEERARYVDALAGEIERTLESVDGVVSARVHLVLEEADPLAVDAKPRAAGARRRAARDAARATRPSRARTSSASSRAASRASTPRPSPSSSRPRPPPPRTSRRWRPSGPLRVTPGSRALLVGALAAGLGAARAARRAPARDGAPPRGPRARPEPAVAALEFRAGRVSAAGTTG